MVQSILASARHAKAFFWVKPLAAKPRFARAFTGKILIVCSDCAQLLPARSWVSNVNCRRFEILQENARNLNDNVLFRSIAST
jgi:hypothetical protein